MGEVINLDKYRRDRKRQQSAEKGLAKKRDRVRRSRNSDPCTPNRPCKPSDLIEDDPA